MKFKNFKHAIPQTQAKQKLKNAKQNRKPKIRTESKSQNTHAETEAKENVKIKNSKQKPKSSQAKLKKEQLESNTILDVPDLEVEHAMIESCVPGVALLASIDSSSVPNLVVASIGVQCRRSRFLWRGISIKRGSLMASQAIAEDIGIS